MSESEHGSFLIVRFGALGDIVHTVPAAAALRSSFPKARLGWVVEGKWVPLVQMVSGVDEVIPLEKTAGGYIACIQQLRRAGFSCAVDFQGLYKSALLVRFSGAPRRIGRDRASAREPGAALFYTQNVRPAGRHVAEMNLGLAEAAGARVAGEMQFPLRVPATATQSVRATLTREGIGEFIVVSPGGGWKSKCWPAARYGELCGELWRRHGLRAVVNAGPNEAQLAQEVLRAAAPAQPLVISLPLVELAALLAQARLVVAADTGPLHLAAALETPNVALFGPTDPVRNGPLPRGLVLRSPSSQANSDARGAYERRTEYSPEMLALSVSEVLAAVERELAGTS